VDQELPDYLVPPFPCWEFGVDQRLTKLAPGANLLKCDHLPIVPVKSSPHCLAFVYGHKLS